MVWYNIIQWCLLFWRVKCAAALREQTCEKELETYRGLIVALLTLLK